MNLMGTMPVYSQQESLKPPTQESVVTSQFLYLEKQIDEMDALLGGLALRLDPVRNKIPSPSSNEKTPVDSVKSPLAQRIRTSALKLEALNQALAQVIREIEL